MQSRISILVSRVWKGAGVEQRLRPRESAVNRGHVQRRTAILRLHVYLQSSLHQHFQTMNTVCTSSSDVQRGLPAIIDGLCRNKERIIFI